MKRSFGISAESPNAHDDIRRQLAALPIDKDEMTKISIEIEAEASDSILDAVGQARLEEFETYESGEEFGPVPASQRQSNPNKGGTGGGNYHGTVAEDAVMPDTKHATVLRSIEDRWKTYKEISDDTGVAPNSVSAYLSQSFLDYGYVKRRSSKPYEWSLDQDGKSALRLGEQLHEEDMQRVPINEDQNNTRN